MRFLHYVTIALYALALTLQGCAATPTQPSTPVATVQPMDVPESDVQAALATLKDYLTALNEGRYDEAVLLFSGAYDALVDQNPVIAADNRAELFESGCMVNGYQCLKPRSITYDPPPVSSTELRFVVEFEQPDGSLFARLPRPGETVEPESRFLFIVFKDGDTWKVRDLPPYVA